MRELYGGALGKFVPNPNLKPITANMGEVGLEWMGTKLSGSITAFLNRANDTIGKITLQQGPDAGKEKRINLDGSRVRGIEVVAAAHPVPRLSIDGSVTWMQIRGFLNGEPRKLEEKPSWIGQLTLSYDLPSNFRAMIQSEYMAGVFSRNQQNVFVLLPGALIFDARLSYDISQGSWPAGGELFVRVNNITDELQVLQLGLPGPGRSILGGLRVQF
jgi:iron complex outermembrane receptor protein